MALPFLGIRMNTDLFYPVATAELSRCADIWSVELSQHHLLGFEAAQWIPLPPLAVCIVMLPKAHLTSHSRTSSSS